MSFLNIQPPGVIPVMEAAGSGGRKPIFKVVGGDSWTISLNLYDPSRPASPATPENTHVVMSLSETQFDDPIWTGGWYSGVLQDDKRLGLVHIRVPNEVTKNLRRGSYMFSVRVSDLLKSVFMTEAEGSFLVEYKPTSEQHSIPYKEPDSEESRLSASGSQDKKEVLKGIEPDLDPDVNTLSDTMDKLNATIVSLKGSGV